MKLLRTTLIIAILTVIIGMGCIEERPERLARRETPIAAELRAMVEEAEQVQRDPTKTDEQRRAVHRRHRHRVYELMAQALIRDGEDCYRASLLLQASGDAADPEVFLQAHYLAEEAVDEGYGRARYLAAATYDRYLIRQNRPQRYGTQYYRATTGEYRLYPYDTTVTDSVRAVWDVPSLDSLQAQIATLNQQIE